ncbi:MAG: hypothetical protein ABSB28_01880 [Candidatus Bathyarchaeia archaeon]
MSRKRWLVLLSVLFLTILLAFFILSSHRGPSSPVNASPSPETPQGNNNQKPPQFVVPETPLGVVSTMMALAAGFAFFTITKKRK